MSNHHSEIAQRAYDAFANRDLAMLVELSRPDVEVHTVTGAVAGRTDPYVGHGGLERYLGDVAEVWDEIELQPHEFVELDDDRVLVVGRVRARRGSARTDMPNAWLWEFEGELVRRVSILPDATTVQALLAGRRDGQPSGDSGSGPPPPPR